MTAIATNIERAMAVYPEEGGTGSLGAVTAWKVYPG
jgi:hypothetical protein